MKINVVFHRDTASVTLAETMDQAIHLAEEAGEDGNEIQRLLTLEADEKANPVLYQLLTAHAEEAKSGQSTLEVLAGQIFEAGFRAGRLY